MFSYCSSAEYDYFLTVAPDMCFSLITNTKMRAITVVPVYPGPETVSPSGCIPHLSVTLMEGQALK